MEWQDHAQFQEKYGGKFVATRDGQVVATGDTHGELVTALEAAGVETREVVFEYVRPQGQIRAY